MNSQAVSAQNIHLFNSPAPGYGAAPMSCAFDTKDPLAKSSPLEDRLRVRVCITFEIGDQGGGKRKQEEKESGVLYFNNQCNVYIHGDMIISILDYNFKT